MARDHRKASGFSLVELLVVIGIITALMGMLVGGVLLSRWYALNQAAKVQLSTISMAALSYSSDWGDFPPFDPAIKGSQRAGAEWLHYYLCQKHTLGERNLGPYMPTNETNLHTGKDVEPALISPLRGFYTFGFEGKGDRRTQWVIVDPGQDKLLGGTVSADGGFRPDNTDANGDGKLDHLDNIIEKVSLR